MGSSFENTLIYLSTMCYCLWSVLSAFIIHVCHFLGGNIPPHGAAVREPEVQNSTGHMSSEHHPQLGQRVQEMARKNGKG